MNLQNLQHSLDYMEREIGQGRKYSPLQRDKIKEAIINESDRSLADAFNFIILNFVGLPTPQKLIESVRIEASKHRQADWDKEKAELNKPIQPRTEFARECMAITMKFFPPDTWDGFKVPVNYQDILDDAQIMAIKYPCSDWPNIYQGWETLWTKEGKIEPRQSSLI